MNGQLDEDIDCVHLKMKQKCLDTLSFLPFEWPETLLTLEAEMF
jgi:hypothetical protein